MDRRSFLASLALGASALGTSRIGHGAQACNPWTGLCRVGIDMAKLPPIYAAQKMSQWCWAACIEMVFAYYGYKVSQERIVQTIYGSVINLPALSGAVISSALDRDWVDDYGKGFHSRLKAAYDFDANVIAIDNNTIISSLNNEIPLIYGNSSHAMVLTALVLWPTPVGPQIVNVDLMDPFPGMGLHGAASPAELYPLHVGGAMRYLGLPEITPAYG